MRGVAGDGRVEVEAAGAGQDVPLPAQHHHGVAAAQQERVAVVGGVGGGEGAVGAKMEDAHRHAAAVHDVHQRDAGAPGRIARHEHHELAPRLHLAGGVAGGPVQVHDLPVVRIGGIEREVHASGDALVHARAAERPADGLALVDRHADHARQRDARRRQHEQQRERHGAAHQVHAAHGTTRGGRVAINASISAISRGAVLMRSSPFSVIT
jgi:hypothetical protein